MTVPLSLCVDVDECAAGPCQNGGTCVNAYAQYICHCSYSFTGVNCERRKYLRSHGTLVMCGTWQMFLCWYSQLCHHWFPGLFALLSGPKTVDQPLPFPFFSHKILLPSVSFILLATESSLFFGFDFDIGLVQRFPHLTVLSTLTFSTITLRNRCSFPTSSWTVCCSVFASVFGTPCIMTLVFYGKSLTLQLSPLEQLPEPPLNWSTLYLRLYWRSFVAAGTSIWSLLSTACRKLDILENDGENLSL